MLAGRGMPQIIANLEMVTAPDQAQTSEISLQEEAFIARQ